MIRPRNKYYTIGKVEDRDEKMPDKVRLHRMRMGSRASCWGRGGLRQEEVETQLCRSERRQGAGDWH